MFKIKLILLYGFGLDLYTYILHVSYSYTLRVLYNYIARLSQVTRPRAIARLYHHLECGYLGLGFACTAAVGRLGVRPEAGQSAVSL